MAEGPTATILLVEDDPLFQRAYETHLQEEGYQVRIAADGEEALRQIEASRPDLVLLDLLLPRMSGYEVLAQVRANPSLAELPVIVLTNRAEPEDMKRAMELGATDYFVKVTARPRQVLWKVRQALTREAGRPVAMRVAVKEKELDAALVAETAGRPPDLHCEQCGGRLVLEMFPRPDEHRSFEARFICPKCGR